MFSYLRWIPGLVFFCCSFLIIAFCLLFISNETTYQITRKLFRIITRIMGIRLSVKGNKQDFSGRHFLVLSNHQSLFDAFVIAPAVPFRMIALEAMEHFTFPLWGYLTRKWGNIPIDRENREEAIEKIKEAVKMIEKGESLLVFPEGHRTRDGQLLAFKKGPFHLAKEVEVPIVPLRIKGLFKFLPKHSIKINPGPAEVIIGKPIEVDEYKDKSVEQLMDLVRSRMLSLE